MNGGAAEQVPLGTGPPTKHELLVHYTHKHTWHQLKAFINSGSVFSSMTIVILIKCIRDLGLLKRDKKLQQRYDEWARGIVREHGSLGSYPDTSSLVRNGGSYSNGQSITY
jgi:hypothetical protein